MSKYAYRARDRSGGLITGVIEDEDKYAAVLNLRNLGYSVIDIADQPRLSGIADYFGKSIKKVGRQETILFTRQLATLLRTGNTLISSLESVTEQVHNQRLKEIIKQVISDVQGGASFSESLSKHPSVFDDFFVAMVKVGETAGLLDEVLDRLAQLGSQELEMRARIQSSLLYPVVLVLLSLGVVSFILIAVLPNFVAIFEASQAKLPLPTKLILSLSWTMRNLWYLIAAVFAFLFIWIKRYILTVEGRYRFDGYLLKMPLFGELYLKVMIARFSRTMAALTKSGIPFHESIAVVEYTITNSVLQKVFEDIRKQVNVGQNVTEAFRSSGIFPPMVIQLINSGEKSGKLDEMFSEVASFYEPEVEYALRNMTSLLEPFLLLVMGLIVGFIALSVLLPIFNLIKIIKS